nr:TMEM175 family protein [Chamaesiphon sp. VAR_48_metabat_403]
MRGLNLTASQRERIDMEKGRLAAFSDGVIAIIITIMVLELKVPHKDNLAALRPLIPVFLSYILSFIYLGIYWNNHHHLFQIVQYVNGRVLWANLHLLFWLSLIPFFTAWMGENYFTAVPVAFYGGVLLFSAIAYSILTVTLIAHHGKDSTIATAIGRDFKGKVSLAIYALSIPLAFANSWLTLSLYVLVAIMWLIPDRRIEKAMS